MREHFQDELVNLKQMLINIANLVEKSITRALESFEEKDSVAANHVIGEDRRINIEEVRFEEECLKVLALYQPVAIDLRIIVAYLKINNDLEKIGDLAANIAGKAVFLAKNKLSSSVKIDYKTMGEKTKEVFDNSLKSLIYMDTDKAKSVIKSDDEIDSMKRANTVIVIKAMRDKPQEIEALLQYLSVVRALERIADMAVNLAEDVIYIAEGNIIRHREDEY